MMRWSRRHGPRRVSSSARLLVGTPAMQVEVRCRCLQGWALAHLERLAARPGRAARRVVRRRRVREVLAAPALFRTAVLVMAALPRLARWFRPGRRRAGGQRRTGRARRVRLSRICRQAHRLGLRHSAVRMVRSPAAWTCLRVQVWDRSHLVPANSLRRPIRVLFSRRRRPRRATARCPRGLRISCLHRLRLCRRCSHLSRRRMPPGTRLRPR